MLLLIGNTRVKSLLFVFLLIGLFEAEAQNKKPKFTEVKINGYFRNYFTYRNMQENYDSPDPLNPLGPVAPKTIMINGLYKDLNNSLQATGYREPLMMIEFHGKPSANTSFDVDFLLDNQMTGQIFNSSTNKSHSNPRPISVDSNAGYQDSPRRIQSARWLNLGGGVLTRYGQFEFKAGGVLNMNMTTSTLNFYQYRDDMFERYPWEWQTNSFKRYLAFYNDKAVVRDPRLGSSSVQGFTLKGSQMPFRTGFLLVYGKANNTNNYQSFLGNNNQDIFAAQINKKFSTHFISFNYYQSQLLINPRSFERTFHNVAKEQVTTSELSLNFKNINLNIEGGLGHVTNPIDSALRWDPLVIAKLSTTKDLMPVPLLLQYYHIGANVVNPNSGILNSSNRNVQAQWGNLLIYNNNIFEGAVAEFGQMVNNRQGVNLSGSVDATKSLRFVLALSSQQELENRFDIITIQHRLNGFNRSQFVYYRNGVGPYGNQMNTWRRSWQKIGVTDTSSYKKGFNLIDFSTKLKARLFNREIIFSNYINYNSVQDKMAPLALFSSEAFVRNLYEEFMIFYGLHRKVSLVGLIGYERVIGNNRTTLSSDNGKPVDQTGHGYGIGLDYDLSSSAGIYFRQRWYDFKDKNFVLDRFRGYDTTVELKIFF